MRVLFLAHSLERGGAERQLAALAAGLHARGVEVRIVLLDTVGAFGAGLVESGIDIVVLAGRTRRDVLARFIREVRAWRPDVVHGYLAAPNLVATLARVVRPGTKVVWGVRHAELRLRDFPPMVRLAETLARPLSWGAHLVIANSEAGARHHRRSGYPRRRLVVVPNGVDLDVFRPERGGRQRVRRAWGVPERHPVVGMVARFDVTKDQGAVVRACGRRRVETWVVLAGAATAADRVAVTAISRESDMEGRVVVLGAVDDVVSVYAGIDIACLASRTEGFPNVVAEAMACGVPCVVTDVGDAGAIVGDTGEVVPSTSPDALAAAIDQLLERLEREPDLGARARARIGAHYGVDRMVDTTLDLLQDLVA